MTVAMPVKRDQENPPLTTVFGKAKWFAFADEKGRIQIEENPYAGSGGKTVAWLIERGADTIVTQHIGGNPFMIFKEAGVKVFHPGKGRLLVSEALEALHEGACEEITMDNVAQFTHH